MYSEHAELRMRGDQSWQTRAACATAVEVSRDPDLFFPATRGDEPRIGLAKRICSNCEVRSTCLEAAFEGGDADGIRGGMTEAERRAIRHRFERRCDPARVAAALAGRDVYLSDAEREDLIRRAVLTETPAARVAQVLKVSEAHAKKLLRRERRKEAGIRLEASDGTLATREAAPA
jgi:WhiB family redox-sensing transcriptional regulator